MQGHQGLEPSSQSLPYKQHLLPQIHRMSIFLYLSDFILPPLMSLIPFSHQSVWTRKQTNHKPLGTIGAKVPLSSGKEPTSFPFVYRVSGPWYFIKVGCSTSFFQVIHFHPPLFRGWCCRSKHHLHPASLQSISIFLYSSLREGCCRSKHHLHPAPSSNADSI